MSEVLVSVLVATYNSERYVVEALESVRAQSYGAVELIVSDDCSTDATPALCRQWIAEHGGRFVRALFCQTERNLGISGNYNHALQQARGTWVKPLDGDDRLLPHCIADLMQASTTRPHIHLWVSAVEETDEAGKVLRCVRNSFPDATAGRQLRLYMRTHANLNPNSMLVHTATLRRLGGYDMRYPMSQDIPLMYRFLSQGQRIGVLPEVCTVQFRQRAGSVSHSAHPLMVQNIRDCRYHYARYFLRYGMLLHYYNACVRQYLATHDRRVPRYRIAGYLLQSLNIVHHIEKLKSLRQRK